MRLALKSLFVFLLPLIFIPVGVFADIDDGFGASRSIQGRHFTIYYAPQLDAQELARQLNVGISDRLLAGQAVGTGSVNLAEMIDALFVRVCGILDMHLYSYEGKIKVCRDHNQLKEIYRYLFGSDLGNIRSFYVHELNTVYISLENFKREVIGHEIGHAVISHYFVVLPSMKVQEVLAVYVEYQLRKGSE